MPLPQEWISPASSCTLLTASKAPLFAWMFNSLTSTLPLPFFLPFSQVFNQNNQQRQSTCTGLPASMSDEHCWSWTGKLLPTPILHVPGIVYKAESYIYPPAANIQPPSVFIQEFQISSSKVTEEVIPFGSAITFFKTKTERLWPNAVWIYNHSTCTKFPAMSVWWEGRASSIPWHPRKGGGN